MARLPSCTIAFDLIELAGEDRRRDALALGRRPPMLAQGVPAGAAVAPATTPEPAIPKKARVRGQDRRD
jgi:hypothetical protein